MQDGVIQMYTKYQLLTKISPTLHHAIRAGQIPKFQPGTNIIACLFLRLVAVRFYVYAWVKQEHIKREKEVMMECSSPFLVNLLAAFKDAAHLYILMELVQGGEFFTYLQASPGHAMV